MNTLDTLATLLASQPAPTLLPQYGMIQITGADAATFIHNQLSQDFLLLQPQQARLAAWCNPKGRMITSFYGIKPQADTVLLLLPADNLEFVLKRLKMYVLRSKCVVEDAQAHWQISGHIRRQTMPSTAQNPELCSTPLEGGYAIQWPALKSDLGIFLREIRIKPAQEAPKIEANEALIQLWDWLQVQSGVALVGAATREAFVPQMINYESVGGVNFKKGCYPGQEVVARSQFRGQVKRRGYLVHAAQALAAHAEVLDAQGQGCGQVAMAAAHPAGGFDAIVSVQTQAAEGEAQAGPLRVGEQSLTLLPLPYTLLEDI